MAKTIILTDLELTWLVEAVRYWQEGYEEDRGDGKYHPALSRVQRKLGTSVGGVIDGASRVEFCGG